MVHEASQQEPLVAAVPTTDTGHRTLLARIWEDEAERLSFMEDCCALIQDRATAGRGIRAATLRACYHTVQSVKPGTVGYVLGKLMPGFLQSLEPMFAQACRTGAGRKRNAVAAELFRDALQANPERAADALLSVTDARIDKARMPIRMAYRTVRFEAKRPVQDAIPELAELLERRLRTS